MYQHQFSCSSSFRCYLEIHTVIRQMDLSMSVFVVVVDDFQIHANSGEQVVYANVEVVFDCSAAAAGCR